MPNLAGVLKEEIRRLARKEIKAELTATRKASAQHRREIAALKRQVKDQARTITSLKRTNSKTAATESKVDSTSVRFSPKWLRAHRERLELSAADYAALVGVSGLTIYNWEKGKTRPRQQQLEAWGTVRSLGKREAWKRLVEME